MHDTDELALRARPYTAVALLALLIVAALPVCLALTRGDDMALLGPRDAFRWSVTPGTDPSMIEAHFTVADGYYLYQDRMTFSASDGVRLGAPRFPEAMLRPDDVLARDEPVHRGTFVVAIPVEPGGQRDFTLTAQMQGCAEGRVCFPPETRAAPVHLAGP